MAVLVEAISVVVRKSEIADRYPGGISQYRADCPNATYCSDDHLIRVGFMTPSDVQSYVGRLELHGFAFLRNGVAVDVVVIDQIRGPTSPCDWVEFSASDGAGAKCWMRGTNTGPLAAPSGWQPGGVHFGGDAEAAAFHVKGHKDKLDILEDAETGAELFVGRADAGLSANCLASLQTRAVESVHTGEWQVGQRLGGHWPIYRVLGGGMGIVYIVYDADFAQLLAAKTFRPAVLTDASNPDILDRFRTEATAWIRIGSHTNVVQAHKVVTVADAPYLLLEYVSGGDLSSWIGTPRLTEDLPQVLSLAIQFCRGMSHAASNGIEAHRDVKPANCLVTETGVLKVTDFGLVKALGDGAICDSRHEERLGDTPRDRGLLSRLLRRRQSSLGRQPASLTASGAMAGTLTHMAPEQFGNVRHADRRSDIYSFGVMLYQMITGSLPFEGRTAEEYMRLHCTAPVPTIRQSQRALVDGLTKCLAKRPSDRFADFLEVEEWLAALYSKVAGTQAPAIEPALHPSAQLLSKAYDLANLGLHEEALAACNRLLELDTESFEAWSLKARILSAIGRHTDALPCHEHAVGIQPAHALVWHSKGVTLNAMGLFDKAIECYDTALAIDDRDARIWYDKGVSLQGLGQIEDASHCWDRTLALAPDHAMAWCNQGTARSVLGDVESAESCYRRALELDPRDAKAWYGLGVLMAQDIHDMTQARQCLSFAHTLGFSEAKRALRNFGLDS